VPHSGCHVPIYTPHSTGYVTIGHDYAHRIAWRRANGEIPDGMTVDHLCFNRACCNADHLRLLTPSANVKNRLGDHAWMAARTACKHGHEYTPENTHVDAHGHRRCRACGREKSRRQREEN
jgi:hypothetical protein